LLIIERMSERRQTLNSLIAQEWTVTRFLLGLCFTVSFFFLLFRFWPSIRIKTKTLWTTSINYTLPFGTLRGFLFFILWIFYSCFVFNFSEVMGWTIGK
jgi:hypothetical protein